MAITRATGTVSEILNVYFMDNRSVSTVGMPNISASSIAFSWCRNNQASQSSGTCTTNTVVGTYSTTALTQISSTSTLGWYQFGVPDGALQGGRSAVVHLWSRTSTAGVTPYSVEIDLLGNIQPVSVSTITTPVGVSSATVNFGVSTLAVPVGVSSASVNLGVSTLATSVSSVTGSVNVSSATVNFGVSSAPILLGVSTLSVPVGVSSYSRDAGVSTIAVGEKLVGVSTLAASVSSVTGSVNISSYSRQAGVSSASVNFGVSTLSVPVGVSSASVNLGVSTLATSVSSVTGSVDVSSIASGVIVNANISTINSATVQGDGTAGNLWRG